MFRFLKVGHTGCNIPGLGSWIVPKLISIRMLTWLLLAERSVNILKQALSMDTWQIKWDQSTLQNCCLRSLSSRFSYICLAWIVTLGRASPWTSISFLLWFLLFVSLFYLLQHLEVVIRQRIPSIIALINKSIDEINAELDRIGRPIAVDSGVTIDRKSVIL